VRYFIIQNHDGVVNYLTKQGTYTPIKEDGMFFLSKKLTKKYIQTHLTGPFFVYPPVKLKKNKKGKIIS
jgi:hypothetical protein